MNVFDAAAAAVRRLPGGGLAARGIEFVGAVVEGAEREVFRYLRYRLDEIASATAPHRQDVAMVPASALMAELLERSVMQDTKSSKADWHAAVLSQLVPDEARVIAALAEASAPVPLLHVLPRVRPRPAAGERLPHRSHGGPDLAGHDPGLRHALAGPGPG